MLVSSIGDYKGCCILGCDSGKVFSFAAHRYIFCISHSIDRPILIFKMVTCFGRTLLSGFAHGNTTQMSTKTYL